MTTTHQATRPRIVPKARAVLVDGRITKPRSPLDMMLFGTSQVAPNALDIFTVKVKGDK